MVEIIVMIGVIGNFVLQLIWFAWSYNVNKRKHYADDEKEIEFHDRIEEYLQLRIHNEQVIKDRDKLWSDFIPSSKSEGTKKQEKSQFNTFLEPFVGINDIENINQPNQPEKLENGKYNPDEIEGRLDSFFEINTTTNSTTENKE